MALHSYPLSYLLSSAVRRCHIYVISMSYLLTDQALLYILKNYVCAFNERKPNGY
jgi:hypothetical protein